MSLPPPLTTPAPLPLPQRLHNRTVSKATDLNDRAYLSRAKALDHVLTAASAAAESYLSPGLSSIAAASKVNTMFRNAWAKTPLVSWQTGDYAYAVRP
jgi:hypothetical protein